MAIKKSWYEIVAPPEFGEVVIGESPAADPNSLIGRTVTISLLDLDPQTPKFWLKMIFKITQVVDSKARTVLIGHDSMAERIHRMVRRRARRVDCVQLCRSADGRRIRVKSIAIIPARVGSTFKAAVRAKIAETIELFVRSNSFHDFIKAVISDQLQQRMKEAAKSIYPISAVEVRASQVLD